MLACKHIHSAMKSDASKPVIGEFQLVLFDVCCDPPNPKCGISPRYVVCESCSEYYQTTYKRGLVSHFHDDEVEVLDEIERDPQIGRVPTCSICYQDYLDSRLQSG